MIVFYKICKNYNEIQLTKKMDGNNQKMKNGPPSHAYNEMTLIFMNNSIIYIVFLMLRFYFHFPLLTCYLCCLSNFHLFNFRWSGMSQFLWFRFMYVHFEYCLFCFKYSVIPMCSFLLFILLDTEKVYFIILKIAELCGRNVNVNCNYCIAAVMILCLGLLQNRQCISWNFI